MNSIIYENNKIHQHIFTHLCQVFHILTIRGNDNISINNIIKQQISTYNYIQHKRFSLYDSLKCDVDKYYLFKMDVNKILK